MTTEATVLAYLFLHVGVILVAVAYFAVGAALAPRLTLRARDRFARRPWLPVVIGAVISVPCIVAALVLLNANVAALKFTGASVAVVWILLGLVGGAAIASHMGGSAAPGAASPWTATVRGGLFLSLTWVLPIVGWLVVLPLTLFAGIGCLVLGLLPVRAASAPLVLGE